MMRQTDASGKKRVEIHQSSFWRLCFPLCDVSCEPLSKSMMCCCPVEDRMLKFRYHRSTL
jgi:hypothetical protein